jgi:hypothetical protein
MPTVTDTDFCTVTDAGEDASLPRVTVTGTSVTDGAGGQAEGLVVFDSGQLQVVPGIGGPSGVLENPVITQVYAGVMGTVSLPDSQLAFPSSFSYTITLKIEGFPDLIFTPVVISRNRFPAALCDLSQLV